MTGAAGLEPGVSPVIQTVDEYDGQAAIYVSATQNDHLTQAKASSIVKEWCEFFSSGPSPIEHLAFVSRTPSRLFDSLAEQVQLRSLELKWGDYSDLSALGGMAQLESLTLGGGVAVTSLEPLTALQGLRELVLENTWRLHDYSALSRLPSLISLTVTEGWSGRRLHAESIEFLADLHDLQDLIWSPIVDSGDYSPALHLADVPSIHIVPSRNMTPTHADLEWALPGMQATARERADHVIPVIIDGDYAGRYETDIDGKMRFHPRAE